MRWLILLLIPLSASAEYCGYDRYGNFYCYENPAISSGRSVGNMFQQFGQRPSVIQGAQQIQNQRLQNELLRLEIERARRQLEE